MATSLFSVAALVVTLAAVAPMHTAAHPAVDTQELSALKQEMALRQQILSDVAQDLDAAWRDRGLALESRERALQKRTFAPLNGMQDESPTAKRQVRYHQCYFNPISCFR
ncbi:Allatostatin C Type I precursor protein [Hyalella azteca]|uniref:Allatostatin C Type I protein n=1 Tax=Hyalella azteca TaxID=294128 RepID=A0A6A0HDM2_HYAAZ|nr:Allatostatin C Type I precursor protein [Hyalella azteca]